MDDTEKRIRTLLKIPSLVNWVRHNKRRLDDTIFQLQQFTLNPPHFSLRSIQIICADLACRNIDQIGAMQRVENLAHVTLKAVGREVIPAFCRYLADTPIEGVPELARFQAMYVVGKKPDNTPLLVPVKPTFVGIRAEKLVPVFVVPWASFNLDPHQKYLLSTVICDSILTQEDFLGSDAEIVAFPRIKHTKTRTQQGWMARQYDLLSQDDLMQQFERYGRALNAVISELRKS